MGAGCRQRAIGSPVGDRSVAAVIAQGRHQVEHTIGGPRSRARACLAHGTLGHPAAEGIGIPLGEAGDGQAVGDGPRTADLLDRVPPARRLEDHGAGGVGDEIGVVVAEARMLLAGPATLAVLLQQADDDLHGRMPIARPLQRQPQQVHPRQVAPAVARPPREDRLVADGHAVFVGAHLGTPLHHGREINTALVCATWSISLCVRRIRPGSWRAAA